MIMRWHWQNLKRQWVQNNMKKIKDILVAVWHKCWSLPLWAKLVFLVILVAAVFGIYKHFVKAPPTPKYRLAKVERGDIKDVVEASGPLAPVNTTEVGALVSGEILKIYVDYNSQVKKGDLMALIDPTQIQTDFDQAQASLSSAKEDLESVKMAYNLAQSNLKRYQALYKKNYVAKTDLEKYELEFVNAKSSLNSAESRVIQAQAGLERAQKDLDNTRIIAPIDGIVLSKKVSEGQALTSGYSTPEMFTLAQDLTKMQIEAKVSEADVVKIKEGQMATFTLDGYPDEKFQGEIRQVRTNYSATSSSSANSSSNGTTYTVVISVDNTEGKFMPGMTATITIITQDKKDVLLVPNEALRFSPSFNQEKFTTTGVWVMEKGKQQPERQAVTIGIIGDKKTEIKSDDIQEGEMVVISENKQGLIVSDGPGRPRGRR